ncbi:LysR substrate-binding domain-containing protein [Vibrio sp. PP-XX7]
MLRSVDDALNLSHTDADASGRIRLAASYTVQGYFLPYHLQRLTQWYPNISIELYEFERVEIEKRLIDHSIDMAIVLTDNLTHMVPSWRKNCSVRSGGCGCRAIIH